jgi:hypothetical protein
VAYAPEYAEVPDVPRDAQVDPHFAELTAGPSLLPASYMPPAMPGEHPRWRRISAIVLITMFTTATAGGVCLTYGPGELLALLRR